MNFVTKLFHTLFHLGELQAFINDTGPRAFVAVILMVLFCETGLVITPFLPGDSLLFAVGALGAGANAPYKLSILGPALVLAALCGDNLNYWLGRTLGPKVFASETSRVFNRKYLTRTQSFYDTYGAKTIILARFVPIVRTFAPFVAGIGRMPYPRFLAFSVIGAVTWVSVCLSAGYFLANVDFVKKHFEVVALAIVFISVLPMLLEFMRHRSAAKSAARDALR